MNDATPPPEDESSRGSPEMDEETKTLDAPQINEMDTTTTTRDFTQPDTETKTIRRPDPTDEGYSPNTMSSGSTTNIYGDVMRTTEGGESQMIIEEDGWGEYLEQEGEEEDSRKSASWSQPDFQTDWSDFEITVGPTQLYDESEFKIDAIDSFYPGINREEGKYHINETHGYTFIDTTEPDAFGNKRIVRKFVPRIYQKTRTYKKMVPMKVNFTKLINDVELVEEEEDINEEMEIDEIINTCLIKTNDSNGEEVEEEKEIIQETIKYPGKKKRYIKLKMINDLGEVIEELVELNNDPKRTNDIMKLAVPFLKKKTKTATDGDSRDKLDGYDKAASMAHPEWYKAKDTQKDLIKMKIIERLKVARDAQKALKEMNKYLGKRLCEYYDLKGPKVPHFVYDERGNCEEEKQKYQKRLLEFNDVISFIFTENKKRAEMILQAEKDTQNHAEKLKKEKQSYYGMEEAMLKDIDPAEECKALRSMVRSLVHSSQTRGSCLQKTFGDLINHQKAMDSSLAKVRLDFIRSQITLKDLQNKKAAHQEAIDNMEKVDFISFESLRFKTKDLNDKLDLKEKQVLMMKDRLTHRVQALAHVRLKSDHLTVENEKLRFEMKDMVEELDALRKECLLVQIERRKLEKQLSKVTSKEGIEKYPYLMSEAATVEAKGEEQFELLGKLVNTCTNLKSEMKTALEKHKKGVEKHKRIQEDQKQKKKLFSFEFK